MQRRLTERQIKILILRYIDKLTLEDVAVSCGVTRERIRQILSVIKKPMFKEHRKRVLGPSEDLVLRAWSVPRKPSERILFDEKTMEKLYSEKEIAALLKVSPITLWRERKAGRLNFRRICGGIRYAESDLAEYVERSKVRTTIKDKRELLEEAGWKLGTVAEYLELSPEEARRVGLLLENASR